MESLALVVTIILAVALFSGPIALFLTWLPVLNRDSTSDLLALVRRIFVTLLSVIGSFVSFILFMSSLSLFTTALALIASITAFFAVKREYFPYGFGGKFGGGSDPRNGPSGQH